MPQVAAFAAAAVGAIGSAIASAGAVASIVAAGTLGALGLPSALVLAGSSLAGALFSSTALLTVGLSLVGGVLQGKPNLGASSGSQADWNADPNAGVPYALGTTGTAGAIVYRRSAGAKLKYDTFVTVHSAAGPIEGEVAYYANSAAIGFGADGGEGQDGFYKNRMWRKASLGPTPAPHLTLTATGSKDTPADHGGIPADWDAACKLSGLAADMLVLEYDTAIFAGGPPKPLRKIKGVKCYDPRKDSTYPGGSGSHRWADPADTAAHDAARLTWEWTERPHLHALHWTLGRWERDLTNPNSKYARTLGVGAPITAIDVPAFVEGANVCDAHDWKVSGVVYSTGDKFDILGSMLQAGSARTVAVGAKISCLTNAPKVSLDTITGADLIGEAQIAATQTRRDRINAIWPRYLEEGAGWQIVPTRVPVTVPAYEPADGGRKTKEVEYTLVPSADQVATLARYDIENTREIGPITLPLTPYWHGYKGGDCLTVNEPELGLVNQKCLLLDRKLDMGSMSVTFTLRSETDAKHPFALGETADPPPIPALTGIDHLMGAPGADAFSAGSELIAGADGTSPVIVITGEVDSPYVLGIVVDYRQVFPDGTYGGWQSEEFPPDSTRIILTGLAPGGLYQVHVRYRTVAGLSGFDAHVDLGQVTLGALTATTANEVAAIAGRTPAQVVSDLDSFAALVTDLSDRTGGWFVTIQAALDASDTSSVAGRLQTAIANQATDLTYLGAKTTDGSGTYWALSGSTVIAAGSGQGATTFNQLRANIAGHSASITQLSEIVGPGGSALNAISSQAAAAAAVAGAASGSAASAAAAAAQANDILNGTGGLTLRSGVALDNDGHVVGYYIDNNGTVGAFRMVVDALQFIDPNGGAPFNFIAYEDGELYLNATVRAKRLIVNGAVVPVRVSASASIGGTGSLVSALTASLVLEEAGWVEVVAAANQSFMTSAGGSYPWGFQLLINGGVVWAPGGTVPGDSVPIIGAAYCGAGTVSIELKWSGDSHVTLLQRTLFAKGMNNTE